MTDRSFYRTVPTAEVQVEATGPLLTSSCTSGQVCGCCVAQHDGRGAQHDMARNVDIDHSYCDWSIAMKLGRHLDNVLGQFSAEFHNN
ncbi:MAG: hypothetical protein GY820_44595 [Gammaproteobacteria bacterium]|nr:hypothetical protein [Gammaproteobacteria bacterium]